MGLFWELPVDPRNVFANWFIGNTDPALDVGNNVSKGKPWIQFENDSEPWGLVLGLFVRNADNTAWVSMLSSGPTGPQGIPGAAGADGADGSIIRSGSGVPSNGLGVDDDWYIDVATDDLYQKAVGTYALMANIKGSTGSTGPIGPPGVGLKGEDGDEGSIGPPGPQGNVGATGSTGSQGSQGLQGNPGPPGFDGEDGQEAVIVLTGLQGVQGVAGSNGTNGTDGAQGISGPPGLAGQDGEDGFIYPPGNTGPAGTTGGTGAAGNDGAAGAAGATGQTGSPGPRGDDGDDGWVYPPGQTGATGAAGAAGASGVGALQSKSANYTALTTDTFILCDASAGAFTITLPAVSGNSKQFYHIKKTDTSINAVTVDGNASETIDGALTYVLGQQFQSVTIVCDGTQWWIL